MENLSLYQKMMEAHFDITGEELLTIVDTLYESAKVVKSLGYTEIAKKRINIADNLLKEYNWLLKAYLNETK